MIRLLPLLFLLSTVFSSQITVNQDSTYYLITTNNDTTEITWYRISHYFSYYFCEYKTMDKEYKKVDIDELLGIENSNGFILYPDSGIKITKKFISSQKKQKKSKLKRLNEYKGWRIIGGINLNMISTINTNIDDIYAIPASSSYNSYNRNYFRVSNNPYSHLRIGIEKSTTKPFLIFGMTYKKYENSLFRPPLPFSSSDILQLHLDFTTLYFLTKFNVLQKFALLSGLEYCFTVNGILKLYHTDFNSGENYKYEKQFKIQTIRILGLIFGTEYRISKKIGVRLLLYTGIPFSNMRLSGTNYMLLDPKNKYMYLDSQLTIYHNL